MMRIGKRWAGIVCCLAAVLALSACGGKSAADYYKSGIAHMEKQEFTEAEADLKDAVTKNPDRAEYYIDYGFALIENGKIEEALIQFDKAYSKKDNQIVRENNKKVLRAKGIANIRLNQYEEAAAVLEEALAIEEEKDLNRDIRCYLALALRRSGEFAKAAEVYSALIEEKKSDAASYAGRADCYAALGNVEGAVKDYDEAIRLDGGNFSYYFGKYNLYTANGYAQEAKDVLTAAYALKTKSEEDYYNLAVIHYLSGDLDKAAAEMAEAVANGFPEANYYLGSVYRQKGDLENALYYYRQYADTVGTITLAAYYDGIAECHMAAGDYEEALEAVQQGIALKDINCQKALLFKKVAIHERLADYSAAKECAEEYLASYPGDEAMEKELAFLGSRVK